MSGMLKTKKEAKGKVPVEKTGEAKEAGKYDAILGLLQVFVVVSIAYMAYLTYFGTTGFAPKVMAGPAVIYASLLVIKKFVKS